LTGPPCFVCRRCKRRSRPGLRASTYAYVRFRRRATTFPNGEPTAALHRDLRLDSQGHIYVKYLKGLGWLVRVEYNEEQQRSLVRTLLEDVLEENRKRRSNEQQEYVPTSGNLLAYLNRYAPILKHKSFEEEFEWRIITRPRMSTDDRFAYRVGASMLIPYYRLSLGDLESLGIQEIVIGPTPHPKEARASVHGLLIKNGIPVSGDVSPEGVKLRRSEVPFRNW
jgi:hypothetical protein